MPQLPWFHEQFISYLYEMPTMKAWQRLADSGTLSGPQAVFMARSKPTEELYDTQTDPFEVRNLAGSAEHRDVLERLRRARREWMEEIVDLGLLPEADLRTRFGSEAPYAAVRRDPGLYPLRRIADAADLANARDPATVSRLVALLGENDAAIRYWGAIGLGSLIGDETVKETAARAAAGALGDSAPWVRVAAADALCRLGRAEKALPTLVEAMKDRNPWVRLQAINVLDRLDSDARSALSTLKGALKDSNSYVVLVAKHALDSFETKTEGPATRDQE